MWHHCKGGQTFPDYILNTNVASLQRGTNIPWLHTQHKCGIIVKGDKHSLITYSTQMWHHCKGGQTFPDYITQHKCGIIVKGDKHSLITYSTQMWHHCKGGQTFPDYILNTNVASLQRGTNIPWLHTQHKCGIIVKGDKHSLITYSTQMWHHCKGGTNIPWLHTQHKCGIIVKGDKHSIFSIILIKCQVWFTTNILTREMHNIFRGVFYSLFIIQHST